MLSLEFGTEVTDIQSVYKTQVSSMLILIYWMECCIDFSNLLLRNDDNNNDKNNNINNNYKKELSQSDNIQKWNVLRNQM